MVTFTKNTSLVGEALYIQIYDDIPNDTDYGGTMQWWKFALYAIREVTSFFILAFS